MPRLVPIGQYLERFYRVPPPPRILVAESAEAEIARIALGPLQPIQLLPYQRFVLESALTPDANARLPYRTIVYSTGKKRAKSILAAGVASWFAFSGIGEPFGEIYSLANDLDQAASRVFKFLRRSVEAEPLLRKECVKIQDQLIELKNGTIIQAIASEAAGAAGANPEVTIWDELWAYTSARSRLLFEEMVPVPTRRNSFRFIVTYAGVSGQAELLEEIYKRTVQDRYRVANVMDLPIYVRGDTFVFWDHEIRVPWITPEFLAAQQDAPGFRISAYRRHWENKWAENEDGIDMDEWDAAVERGKVLGHVGPPEPNKTLVLAGGIDASEKKDRAAVATCFRRGKKIWKGPWRCWQPTAKEPLDMEETIEKFVLNLQAQYRLRIALYDPYQMLRSSQLLTKHGIRMVERRFTIPNNVELATHFLDLLRYGNFVLYPDAIMRKSASVVGVQSDGKGTRFIKRFGDDPIIALALAALAAESLPEMADLKNNILFLR